MNDQLKELIARIPFTLIGALYVLFLGYQFYSFNSSQDSPYVNKIKQLDTMKLETSQLQAKAKQAEEFYKTLDLKRAQLRAMSQDLQEIKATLSEDVDIAALIKLIVLEAKKVGLTVTSIRPLDQKISEFYIEQPFDVQFRGIYGQLLAFLEHLASVERIVRVDNYDILRATGTNNGSYPQLTGSVQIKAFRYMGTKADDVARSGGSDMAPASSTNTPKPTTVSPPGGKS